MTLFVDSSASFRKRQVAVANIRMVVTSVMAMETEDEPDSLEVSCILLEENIHRILYNLYKCIYSIL